MLTDSYKMTHWLQYPPETETVYSYFESRGGLFPYTVFFGLQYLLKRYLAGVVVTPDEVGETHDFAKLHFGGQEGLFNLKGWEHIALDHGGVLPIRICAVPEGSVVPVHTPLMTVENTCPQCYWLTNYLETLLVQAWYPTTVATLSREAKKIFAAYLAKTADKSAIPNLDFKLHDFGFRGVSSVESAAIGGAAHLVNFKGTDTFAALALLRDYYHEPCAGFSIPASEHSTITSWGEAHEIEAIRNMLTQYPQSLVACVCDSYNIYAAVKAIGTTLKDAVLARNGTLVVRPDSGNPSIVVCDVLAELWHYFGGTTNSKGYKVLDPHVRVIQGDGISNLGSIDDILSAMEGKGWSTDNIAMGMGGGLLQKVNRDTNSFAFKCSAIKVAGQWRDVYKSPVTDPGKRSKAGRFDLPVVFEDGRLLVDHKLEDIRKLAAL